VETSFGYAMILTYLHLSLQKKSALSPPQFTAFYFLFSVYQPNLSPPTSIGLQLFDSRRRVSSMFTFKDVRDIEAGKRKPTFSRIFTFKDAAWNIPISASEIVRI